jgi:Rrf2 family transcriptional regulator, cysteine metabolism repressor
VKLTTKSEYALLALIYMAREKNTNYVKTEGICKKYGFSKKYLDSILITLKNDRYVESKRGSLGGYRLALPANKIKIAGVVRIMDGALAPSGAVSVYFYESSPIEKEKKMLSVLKDIREYIANKLEKLTIADLI